jgi:hypothetical protein
MGHKPEALNNDECLGECVGLAPVLDLFRGQLKGKEAFYIFVRPILEVFEPRIATTVTPFENDPTHLNEVSVNHRPFYQTRSKLSGQRRPGVL